MIFGIPLHYDQDLSLPPSHPEGGSAVRSAPTLANISPTSLSFFGSLVHSFIGSLEWPRGRGGAEDRRAISRLGRLTSKKAFPRLRDYTLALVQIHAT